MELLPIAEAARVVEINDQTLRNYVRDKKLSEYKVKGRLAVDMVEVRALFSNVRVSAPATTETDTARVFAIANQKGGVGKTTTASALGFLLALKAPTLVIDSDPQGNLTLACNINPDELQQTLYEVLVHSLPIAQIIQSVPNGPPGLSLIGSNLDLAQTTLQVSSRPYWGALLRTALTPVLSRFRYIVIDCPPNLDALTINAIVAATEIIVPVDMSAFSLRGTSKLLQTMRDLQPLNPGLPAPRFLACRSKPNTLAESVKSDLVESYGGRLFKTVIREAIAVGKAQYNRQPLNVFAPTSTAAQDYAALCEELLDA